MRYLIYEPSALASIDPDTFNVKRKSGMPPWRRCPTEESAAQVIRDRYPDAMPGPYETTTDNGEKFPVLLVWESAKDLMDSKLPVLMVEPAADVAADTKQLKRYRKGDREAAPFTRSIWTRGVVPEPVVVVAEREAKARFTGFIGEIDTTMRVGQTADGRSGLWFEVAAHGPFSIAVPVGQEIVLRDRICRPYPADATVKTIGEESVRCAKCGSTECWDGYLRWEQRLGIGLNKDAQATLPEIEAPFHQLFRRTDLTPNVDYVRRYRSSEDDDTMRILKAAEEDYRVRGLTFDAFMGKKNASGTALLDWYANGDPPEPRPGMIALFHPQFHKRDWEKTADTLTAMAKALERWIWVCECEESRWIMAMVGDPPPGDGEDADGHPAWERHVRYSDRGSDQYIGVISPSGEWRCLGVS